MSTTPTTPSDPQAMPLADLKQAAGLNEPQPEITPADPVAPVQPEWGQMAKNEDGTYQVTLATGEVFKGSADEVITKQAEAHVQTKRWGQEWKQKADAAQPVQPQTQPVVQQLDPAALETARWMRDQADLADAHEFGITVDQLRYNRRLALQGAPQTYLDAQANEFKNVCKDWTETPQNLQAMHGYFSEYKGIPSAAELRLAWLDLKDAGKVVPLALQQGNAQATPRPPVMPTAGASQPTGDQNAWSMDMNALKKAAGLG